MSLEKAIRIIEREMDKMSTPKVPDRLPLPSTTRIRVDKVVNGFIVTDETNGLARHIAKDGRGLQALLVQIGLVGK